MTSGCVGVGIGSSNNVKTKKIMYDLAGDLNDGLDESGYIEKKNRVKNDRNDLEFSSLYYL